MLLYGWRAKLRPLKAVLLSSRVLCQAVHLVLRPFWGLLAQCWGWDGGRGREEGACSTGTGRGPVYLLSRWILMGSTPFLLHNEEHMDGFIISEMSLYILSFLKCSDCPKTENTRIEVILWIEECEAFSWGFKDNRLENKTPSLSPTRYVTHVFFNMPTKEILSITKMLRWMLLRKITKKHKI